MDRTPATPFTHLSVSTGLEDAEGTSVIDRSIPGGWTERVVGIGSLQLQLVLPAQPDLFLERLAAGEASADADPYWAELWPASEWTAALLLRQSWAPRIRTLELGCGVGLLGLAALHAGLEVTFSDRDELAVATAVENAARNGWSAASGRVLDWRAPPTDGSFPLILAADVLYDAALHDPLLNTLDALLAADGVCWIGDPGRSAAVPFCELSVRRGYRVESACFALSELAPRLRPTLYRLCRSTAGDLPPLLLPQ